MEDYYRRRAEKYEEVYHRNDLSEQEELARMANVLRRTFRGRRVLEVACGTGYWTRIVSETARSIVATDIVQEMLDIAKRKRYECPVSFRKEDAYALSFADGSFDGGVANFWLSHVPKKNIDFFLRGFHRVLQSRSRVFMADNVYVPGVGGKLVSKEGDENTYKLRRPTDESESLILKNYYSSSELTSIFNRFAREFTTENVSFGRSYWYAVYELR